MYDGEDDEEDDSGVLWIISRLADFEGLGVACTEAGGVHLPGPALGKEGLAMACGVVPIVRRYCLTSIQYPHEYGGEDSEEKTRVVDRFG